MHADLVKEERGKETTVSHSLTSFIAGDGVILLCSLGILRGHFFCAGNSMRSVAAAVTVGAVLPTC